MARHKWTDRLPEEAVIEDTYIEDLAEEMRQRLTLAGTTIADAGTLIAWEYEGGGWHSVVLHWPGLTASGVPPCRASTSSARRSFSTLWQTPPWRASTCTAHGAPTSSASANVRGTTYGAPLLVLT